MIQGCVEVEASRGFQTHYMLPVNIIHMVSDRMKAETVGWFDGQVAGLTLTRVREESRDLEDWFVNLFDDFLF